MAEVLLPAERRRTADARRAPIADSRRGARSIGAPARAAGEERATNSCRASGGGLVEDGPSGGKNVRWEVNDEQLREGKVDMASDDVNIAISVVHLVRRCALTVGRP